MRLTSISRELTRPNPADRGEADQTSPQNLPKSPRVHDKPKFAKIAISSSTNCSFYTQRTIRDVSSHLQRNGFAGMFWNEQDDALRMSIYRLPLRLRILEKCQFVIVFLTADYFDNLYSFLEAKLILYRKDLSVIIVETEDTNREHSLSRLLEGVSCCTIQFRPEGRRTFGELVERIQKSISGVRNQGDLSYILGEDCRTGKSLPLWTTQQVIGWMGSINIPEEIVATFKEQNINGALLSALTEADLLAHMNIQLNQIRKRILCSRDSLMRGQRPQPGQHTSTVNNIVLILYDGSDGEKHEKMVKVLELAGFQVSSSLDVRDSCLIVSGQIASWINSSSFVMVELTQHLIRNREWLNILCYAIEKGKRVVGTICQAALTKWSPMLLSLLNKSILVEFTFYLANLSEDKLLRVKNLLRWMRSHRRVENWPGTCRREIVSISEFMADHSKCEKNVRFDVILFFHWDLRSQANQVEYLLAKNKISCWSELTLAKERRSHGISYFFRANDDLSIECVVATCSVVIFVISSDYICGNNFQNDLCLAVKLNKQIIFVLAEVCLWPPLFASKRMRRIAKLNLSVDLSNEAMFQRNRGALVKHVQRRICPNYGRLNTYA